MSIASLDNEMNEAMNKIVFVYAKIMIADAPADCNDIKFDDIIAHRSCGTIIKNAAAFIYKFASFFEHDADSFTSADIENNPVDVTKNYYLADIQFNVNRAQQVIDRMGTMIKGSQYINQQMMVN